jgi:hypothetical protein
MSRRTLMWVVLLLAVIFALWFNQDRGLKAVAAETHAALCALKNDLAGRKARSEEFLADVHAGRRPRIEGISDNDLRRSIDNQQDTLDVLSELSCS